MDDATQARIRAFFDAYAERFRRAIEGGPGNEDVEGTAGAFAAHFVEASPHGVIGGPNGEAFRQMVPAGYAFYRSIGTVGMAIAGLTITPIDAMHAMARVAWDSRYNKDGAEVAIPFEVVYMLQVRDGEPKIFAYVTGDERRVLREHGLLPEEPVSAPAPASEGEP